VTRRPSTRALAIIAAGIACLGAVLVRLPGRAPDFAEVRARYRPSEARLLDRHGELLSERRVDATVRRLPWTRLDDVSPALVDLVVASEDRRFWQHGGVDWLALAAAGRDAATVGRRRGASTLSMQLASLLDPVLGRKRRGRSLAQKLRQMRAAWSLEARWSKEEILEAYLNLATFRGEHEGVGAAASGLFSKASHGLDAAEAAVLAVLLRAPNASIDAVATRAASLVARTALPVSPELVAARARDALARPPRVVPSVDLAPHVASRLLGESEAREVRTTIDASIQREAAVALREQLLLLSGQNVRDGAVIVLDNASGDVLAWVGSSGSLSPSPHVDGVRARRQAGSTLKPFLYALAFEERLLTPTSRIDDAPLEVSGATGVYRPENYDGSYLGPVPAGVALASSLNTPAVRVVQTVGVESFVERLAALGFKELQRPDHYGESVALGSADVTLLEVANAYRSLARRGLLGAVRLRADDPASENVRVTDPGAAFLVSAILSDRASRGVTFGLESALATPVWTAVKTGTSKDMRDNWCIGFSSAYTVAVWVGNFDGSPMWRVSGVEGAAPAWLAIMQRLHAAKPSTRPLPPPGVIEQAGSWYLAGTEPVPGVVRAPAQRVRRIETPSDQAILAIDPDIPASRQRVFFESEPRDPALVFRLDGRAVGSAGDLVLWPMERGKHRLELVDAEGVARDVVRFEVR
jgi:penicillin-binding protein 1C